jgi:2-polyprenyl-6-methoxyphenol hydroxylase-like FAD-dependent oxidoreductase
MCGDALVVGGGPAGASAALALRRAGMQVALLEQRGEWQGRVCGAFISPEGVGHLAWLDVLDRVVARGAVTVAASRLSVSSGRSAVVPIGCPGRQGLGIPRETLESILLDAVRGAGGEVRLGARVTAVERVGTAWDVAARMRGGREVIERADLVVLAGGRFSGSANRDVTRGQPAWFGWNATFEDVRQAPGDLSMHFYPRGYVGLLTFADGATNVCGLTCMTDGETRQWDVVWRNAVADQPALARLTATARRTTEWRGVGALPFSRAMRASEGPLLAGDAAAVGDPYMGEGISRALGTGPILYRAIAEAVLAPDDRVSADRVGDTYSRLWRSRYASRFRLGTAVRALQQRPRLFSAGLGLLLCRPGSLRAVTRVVHPQYPVMPNPRHADAVL